MLQIKISNESLLYKLITSPNGFIIKEGGTVKVITYEALQIIQSIITRNT